MAKFLSRYSKTLLLQKWYTTSFNKSSSYSTQLFISRDDTVGKNHKKVSFAIRLVLVFSAEFSLFCWLQNKLKILIVKWDFLVIFTHCACLPPLRLTIEEKYAPIACRLAGSEETIWFRDAVHDLTIPCLTSTQKPLPSTVVIRKTVRSQQHLTTKMEIKRRQISSPLKQRRIWLKSNHISFEESSAKNNNSTYF